MSKRVLDVGNCSADHGAIRRLIEGRFDAHVVPSHTRQEALEALRTQTFDLVLVNRKLDSDYSEGCDVIRAIKADPDLADVPVMLITNYEEHQRTAIQAGAIPGFGKGQLHDEETVKRLGEVLGGP